MVVHTRESFAIFGLRMHARAFRSVCLLLNSMYIRARPLETINFPAQTSFKSNYCQSSVHPTITALTTCKFGQIRKYFHDAIVYDVLQSNDIDIRHFKMHRKRMYKFYRYKHTSHQTIPTVTVIT